MMKTGEIKKKSMQMFNKCWAEAALISLISNGLFCLIYCTILLIARITGAHTTNSFLPIFDSLPVEFVASVAIILAVSYFFEAPLYFGIRWFFWHAAEGNVMPLSSIFAQYNSRASILRCVKLKLMSDGAKFPITFLFTCIIAVEIILGVKLWNIHNNDEVIGLVLIAGLTLLVVCICIIMFILSLKHIPIGYILAANPDIELSKVMADSREMSRVCNTKMMALYLSMFGMMLTCIFVFPLIFVIPYLYMTNAVFIHEGLEYCQTEAQKKSSQDDAAENSAEEEEKGECTVG